MIHFTHLLEQPLFSDMSRRSIKARPEVGQEREEQLVLVIAYSCLL